MNLIFCHLIFFIIFLLSCKAIPNNPEMEFRKGTLLYLQNQRGQALKVFETILEKDSNHLDACLMLGRIHYYDKDFSMAQNYFQKANKIDPGNIKALLWLAKVYALNPNQHALALVYLEKINHSGGELIEARFTKAQVLIQEGNLSQALNELNIALLQEKKLALVRYQIGLIHLKNHQRAKAEKEFAKALILAPDNMELKKLVEQSKKLSY